MLRTLSAALLAIASLAPARALAAGPGETCFGAYESAQSSRQSGQLVRSRAELELCVGTCPTALAADCKRWLAEVDARVAEITVVVAAPGGDAAGARVEVDGLLRERDKPLAVDPGPHVVRVEARGFAPVERRLDLGPGAHRREAFTLEPLAAMAPPGERPPPPPSRSVVPYVLGGGGLLVLAGGGVLTLAGWLDVASMRRTCAPAAGGQGCAAGRIDRDRDAWIAGGVLAGVGGAALTTAIAWIALRPRAARRDATAVSFGAGRDGAGVSLRTSF